MTEFYVQMRDNFLSHWGQSEGRFNLLQITCPDIKSAEVVATNARLRPEMSRVVVSNSRRESDSQTLVSELLYKDLGPIWRDPK